MPKFNSSTHKMKSPVIYLSAKILIAGCCSQRETKIGRKKKQSCMGFDMKEEYSFYNILTGKTKPKGHKQPPFSEGTGWRRLN